MRHLVNLRNNIPKTQLNIAERKRIINMQMSVETCPGEFATAYST